MCVYDKSDRLLIFLWLVIALALFIPAAGKQVEPCQQTAAAVSNPLSLATATQQLQEYLEARAIIATIDAREEGAFMLGAYPRPQVFWSIRITTPSFFPDDPQLALIAQAAYCLRAGGVWLTITSPEGSKSLVSFSPTDLAERGES